MSRATNAPTEYRSFCTAELFHTTTSFGHNGGMTATTANSLPIGVFDSGVGGLTVLKAIREALPAEDGHAHYRFLERTTSSCFDRMFKWASPMS